MANGCQSLLKGKISMMTVRNSNHFTLTGWPAVGVFAIITTTKALTAIVIAWPLDWLANHVFSPSLMLALWGEDHLSYWRCIGMFAIWHVARARINFSGPSPTQKEIDE